MKQTAKAEKIDNRICVMKNQKTGSVVMNRACHDEFCPGPPTEMIAVRCFYEQDQRGRWCLVSYPGVEDVRIRFVPAPRAGAVAAEYGLGEFLIRQVYGPEHIALLALVRRLAEEPSGLDVDLGQGG